MYFRMGQNDSGTLCFQYRAIVIRQPEWKIAMDLKLVTDPGAAV
jgi:hypothetical protein